MLGQEHPEYAATCYLLAGLCADRARGGGDHAAGGVGGAEETGRCRRSWRCTPRRARAAAWQGMDFYSEIYLSLVSQHLADAPEAVGKALDLVLRRKALWVEVLAVCRKALLEEQYPAQRARIAELYFLRRQAAAKRWSGPGVEGLTTHERLLADWEGRAGRLEEELASDPRAGGAATAVGGGPPGGGRRPARGQRPGRVLPRAGLGLPRSVHPGRACRPAGPVPGVRAAGGTARGRATDRPGPGRGERQTCGRTPGRPARCGKPRARDGPRPRRGLPSDPPSSTRWRRP